MTKRGGRTSRRPLGRLTRIKALLGCRPLLPPLALFLKNQHEIADVYEYGQRLAQDDDAVAPGDAVDQRQHAAAHREEPKRQRHHAAAGALACDPLHDEAQPKQKLRDDAEAEPEIEARDENVVEISPDILRQADPHLTGSPRRGAP